MATPEGYRSEAKRYPVLVLLDAEDRFQFNLALANVAFLANRGAIPALIVVGIANGKDRTRDMTPVATGARAKNFPSAGGVGTFAIFSRRGMPPVSKYRRCQKHTGGHCSEDVRARFAATKPASSAGSLRCVVALVERFSASSANPTRSPGGEGSAVA